jgi:hypothetical protein
MIPLKVIMVGFKWELLIVLAIMSALLIVSWKKLHELKLPYSWNWSLLYAFVIAFFCKMLHYVSHHYLHMEPIHIEVLLPAFVFGTVIDTPCARCELELQKRISANKILRRAQTSLTSLGPMVICVDDDEQSGAGDCGLRSAASKSPPPSRPDSPIPKDVLVTPVGEKHLAAKLTMSPSTGLKAAADAEPIGVANNTGVPEEVNTIPGLITPEEIPVKQLSPVTDRKRPSGPSKSRQDEASPNGEENRESSKNSKLSTESPRTLGVKPFGTGLAWDDPYGRLPTPEARMASKQSQASRMSTKSNASKRSLTRYGAPREEAHFRIRSEFEPESEPTPDEASEFHGESEWEEKAQTTISMVFMVLVGLSMPALVGKNAENQNGDLSADLIVGHVIAVSILMIFGKMFPVFCYRDEIGVAGRLALCLGMCPRGEVGASIIVISLELGVSGPAIIVAMCALAGNLVMSGGFIALVKLLLRDSDPAVTEETVIQTIVEEPEPLEREVS